MMSPAPVQPNTPSPDSRAVRILAKSIHRDLDRQGWDDRAIMALATELLSLVTEEVTRARSGAGRP
jgi:hypothetical protein